MDTFKETTICQLLATQIRSDPNLQQCLHIVRYDSAASYQCAQGSAVPCESSVFWINTLHTVYA